MLNSLAPRAGGGGECPRTSPQPPTGHATGRPRFGVSVCSLHHCTRVELVPYIDYSRESSTVYTVLLVYCTVEYPAEPGVKSGSAETTL